jgi:hypothetical protein
MNEHSFVDFVRKPFFSLRQRSFPYDVLCNSGIVDKVVQYKVWTIELFLYNFTCRCRIRNVNRIRSKRFYADSTYHCSLESIWFGRFNVVTIICLQECLCLFSRKTRTPTWFLQSNFFRRWTSIFFVKRFLH